MRIVRFGAALLAALGFCAAASLADGYPYRIAPRAIEDVLRSPVLPVVLVSPSRDTLVLATPLRYPPIADLAHPMLRLAGLRIDPRTNGIHHAASYTSLSIARVRDGFTMRVALPPNAHAGAFRFSPDGKHFVFSNATAQGTDLYVGSTADASIARVPGIELNTVFGAPYEWMPDGSHLVALAVARIAQPPAEAEVPSGPVVQETSGKAGEIVTYEDMLENPHDEDLFEFYGTSRLALVDVNRKTASVFGDRALYTSVAPSPSGRFLLVDKVRRPFSYLFPYERFPSETDVLDVRGVNVATIVTRPLLDNIPVEGVPVGPREVEWKPNAPASVVWWEALDGGDSRAPAPQRDRLMLRSVPGRATPLELARTTGRAEGLTWLADDDRAVVRDYLRATRLSAFWLLDARSPGALKAIGKPLRDGDRYNDPGTPVTHLAADGQAVIDHTGDDLFWRGLGYEPDGLRPFLDRMNLADGTKTRLFRSELNPLDTVLTIGDPAANTVLIQRQSPTLPPNVFLHDAHGDRALTSIADPTPQLRAIERRVVTYKRPDGVDLSFTLYLPPGYKEGTRLPTFLWAYPLEFNDASVASQNANSTQTFTTIGGPSELFMALAGYAVLDNASIPIVGDPQTVNDTYVEQLLAGAKAAIDKAVEIGVTDPNRVAVGGHSYGAFMTMNLLAHSHLFRAGIARSGAYNRTLTPFGFQNERRTYWEATDLYTKMSPFTYADKVTDPVLMIHGLKDDNTGTFPIQSERMYAAIKGNGGTARLVMLPDEAHGYLGRETVETVLAEMVDWLDKWVKNAAPR
jgi:dipeptidyl aminopeptidase/acylaminoacyl peptidase